MNKDVLAVDGDIIAYRTAAVCNDAWEGACEAIIQSTLTDIATDTGVSNMRIYISGSGNFRYDVAKTKPYKGNREGMERPTYLQHCKDFLVREYKAIIVNGYEADDAIASDMTQNGAIHCGQDKDIYQIAGRHYNYVKKEWATVDEEEATLLLYRQILMGDSSDNIPGLPRVGPKKAENIIFNANSAAEDALSFYREVCEDKLPDVDYREYYSEQARLVTMVKDINLLDLFTCFVPAEEEGFESHSDGDFDGVDESEDKVEPVVSSPKKQVRL